MDFFEYLAVMYSIILGLGVADLLRAVGKMVTRSREIRWDWIYGSWLFLLANFFVAWWWGFWDLREVGIEWTFARFMLVALGPALLFMATHIFLPNDPERIEDLRTHYEAVSKRFFLAMLPVMLWAVSLLPLMLGQWSPNLTSQILAVAAILAGYLSRSRRVHAAVVLVSFAGVLLTVFVTRATPS